MQKIDQRSGNPRIYVAVDTADFAAAQNLVMSLDDCCQASDPQVGFKLGLQFFMAHGCTGVAELLGNRPLFLDLKFHDIPNTVAGAVRSVAHLKPNVLNVHAAGGLEMMKAARSALTDCGLEQSTKLIAVSVLTSMDTSDLGDVGQDKDISSQVKRLAKLTQNAGLDGVVCSAHEAAAVRDLCGTDFMRMTPGMRPVSSTEAATGDDQKRAMSPTSAFDGGSSHLVVGRMVTKAAQPAEAVRQMLTNLKD